ncbi:MAG: hypothetical protein MI784_11040 [Cytophagales bacterium]|nr:hypothetical protein [Cytophagales bacterium]
MRHQLCPAEHAKPIQAKIGFEFESSRWIVNRDPFEMPDPGWTYEENLASRRYKKGDVLFENSFWSAQVDVIETRDSYLELVTIPFEETPEGFRQLKEAAREMEAFFNYALRAPCCTVRDRKVVFCREFSAFGEVKRPEACLVFPINYPDPMLTPQATAGIRLNMLRKLLNDIAAPLDTEKKALSKRKEKGRRYLLGNQQTGDYQIGNPALVRDIIKITEAVIRAFQRQWGKQFSEIFRSFFLLVVLYVTRAHWGSATFPKSFTAILARTDFSRMFSLLPEAEKNYLAANDAAVWLGMVKAAMPAVQADLSRPLFTCGVYMNWPEIHRHILKDLSKEQWLKEMTRGRDLLTERHFPNRMRAYELESLGAMGDKTDTVLGEPAPIIEFRGGKKLMDAAEAMSYAEHTFKTIYALNRGLDYYYGEPLEIQ